jgi:hypothetical protein
MSNETKDRNVVQFPNKKERRNAKPLNGPSRWEEEIGYCAGLCIPGGSTGIPLWNEEEVAAYDADPDLFAADYFGLTLDEYREWIRTDGTPLCGAITKAGKPCPVALGPMQRELGPWLALHRNGLCSAHRKMAGRAK